MTEESQVAASGEGLDVLAAPPDDQNPAILDAQKVYAITVVGLVVVCGAISIFILL